MVEFFETYQIGIYLCFLLLPIIQEDVGVLGAASACASGLANPFIAIILVLFGLTTSAMGKYFIGGAANHQSWAKKYALKPGIALRAILENLSLWRVSFRPCVCPFI